MCAVAAPVAGEKPPATRKCGELPLAWGKKNETTKRGAGGNQASVLGSRTDKGEEFTLIKMKMCAVALALTLLGLAGCETAYAPKPFGNDKLDLGVGTAPAAKQHGKYPLPDKSFLFRTWVRF